MRGTSPLTSPLLLTVPVGAKRSKLSSEVPEGNEPKRIDCEQSNSDEDTQMPDRPPAPLPLELIHERLGDPPPLPPEVTLQRPSFSAVPDSVLHSVIGPMMSFEDALAADLVSRRLHGLALPAQVVAARPENFAQLQAILSHRRSNIRSLDCSHPEVYRRMNDDVMLAISQSCLLLQRLDLSNESTKLGASLRSWPRHWVTAVGLQHLGKLSLLEELDLTGSAELRGADLKSLTEIAALKKLSLVGCRKINTLGILHLASVGSLRQLDLTSCDNIQAVWHLSQITHLALGNSQITMQGLTGSGWHGGEPCRGLDRLEHLWYFNNDEEVMPNLQKWRDLVGRPLDVSRGDGTVITLVPKERMDDAVPRA